MDATLERGGGQVGSPEVRNFDGFHTYCGPANGCTKSGRAGCNKCFSSMVSCAYYGPIERDSGCGIPLVVFPPNAAAKWSGLCAG